MTTTSQEMVESVALAVARSHGWTQPLIEKELARPENERLPGFRDYFVDAQAAITAHIAALQEAGYVIVPREPTHEMTLGWAVRPETPFQGTVAAHAHAKEVYRAIITAHTKGK